MTIKAASLHRLALLGVAAALLTLPIDASAAGIALAVTGVVAILLADYGRNVEPLRASGDIVPFKAPERPFSDMRDAA
jgi:hypothetical protein